METADHPVRIAICIASRGRPAALAGVVMAAQRLQSAVNQIAFALALDDDDVKSIQMFETLAQSGEVNVHASIAPRDSSISAAQNRAVRLAMGAEIVTLLSDRAFVITPGWDVGLVDAAIRHTNRVLWWSCPHDPDTTMPIFPHTILDAVGWQPHPEIYPYWYIDTHWAEIDRMVFNGPSLRIRPMYAGARQQTTRGRDFAFWAGVFAALRPKRIEEAKRLNEALGLTWLDPTPEMLSDFYARDHHLAQHAEDFEARFGDPNPPGPEYLAAKARAEAMLKEIGE